jgi:trehalose-phosphatase
VSVEHKRYAVAVHFRNAGPDAAGTVTAAVHDVGKRNGLRVTSGRKVVELRPDVDWDKGKTLQWIAGEMTGDGALLPIFVGDDLTDIDAFNALAEMDASGELHHIVRVGVESEESPPELVAAADFMVAGIEGVEGLLARLASGDS